MANGQILLSTSELERYITRLDTENQEFETIRNSIISDLEQLQSVIKISGFSEITNELQSKLQSATGTIRSNMAICNNFMKKQLIEYTENSDLTSERLANISEGLKGISHVANATPESVASVAGATGVVGTTTASSSAYNQKLEVMKKQINPSFQTNNFASSNTVLSEDLAVLKEKRDQAELAWEADGGDKNMYAYIEADRNYTEAKNSVSAINGNNTSTSEIWKKMNDYKYYRS